MKTVFVLYLTFEDGERNVQYTELELHTTNLSALKSVEKCKAESDIWKKFIKYNFFEQGVIDSSDISPAELDVKMDAPKVQPYVALIEASRANLDKDPYESITYTLARVRNAFPGVRLEFGKFYEFTYQNGKKIIFKRNTDRLYSRKIKEDVGLEFVPLGMTTNNVFHAVVSIKECAEA